MADKQARGEKQEKPRITDTLFFTYCRGRRVICECLNGEIVQGVFVDADRYNIFIKQDGSVVMVFKHALRVLRVEKQLKEDGP